MAKLPDKADRRRTRRSLDLARRVLETEAQAILGLIPQLDGTFVEGRRPAPRLRRPRHRHRHGQVRHHRAKLAATFSSTGTAASFLHPAEALHGDLGVVQTDDVVIALSHSGETEELVRLLEAIRRIGARLISITGDPQSTLGQASDVALSCHVAEEACPMNLAPTASTTATLALGDALAMALSRGEGLQAKSSSRTFIPADGSARS